MISVSLKACLDRARADFSGGTLIKRTFLVCAAVSKSKKSTRMQDVGETSFMLDLWALQMPGCLAAQSLKLQGRVSTQSRGRCRPLQRRLRYSSASMVQTPMPQNKAANCYTHQKLQVRADQMTITKTQP